MIKDFFRHSFLFLVITALSVHSLYSAECHVNKDKNNVVKFISDAPLEDFEGVTDKIDGFIHIESIESLVGSKLYFEVDLNSLDTGIGLRNRHMRENYLHTEKFPFTYFEGEITKSEKDTDSRYKVSVEGQIFIHGKTKDIEASGYITTNNEGSYRIQSKFDIALTDFDIEVPELMFMKIDEKMDIVLDFYVFKVE